MPAVAEIDQIEKYLDDVFNRVDYSPSIMVDGTTSRFKVSPLRDDGTFSDPGEDYDRFSAEAREYRKLLETMRSEMAEKIRASIQQQEELGYSYDEAVRKVVATLKDPAKLRHQVARKADSFILNLRCPQPEVKTPWWSATNGVSFPWFAYFGLFQTFSRNPYVTLTDINLLGLVPCGLGIAIAALRSYQTHQKQSRLPSPLHVIFLAVVLLLAGIQPKDSFWHLLGFGVFCGDAGSVLWQYIFAFALTVRSRTSSF
jgi:hypothetical protein